MPETDNRYLFFESDAVDNDTLLVRSIDGQEEISRLFSFSIELLSRESDLDFDALLTNDARLLVKQGLELSDGSFGVQTLQICGVLTSIHQGEQGADWVGYRVELKPHLWRLSLAMHSRIFIDKTVLEIVEEVLQDSGFTGDDYELRCDGRTYPPREFAVQHVESDLDFIQRLCEHEGIAYHFEHSESGTRLIFSDAPEGFQPIMGPSALDYRPQTQSQARVTAKEEGASAWYQQEVVAAIACEQRVVPEKVILKDYNWRTPQQDLRSEHDVEAGAAFGTRYEYGDHYKDTDQGGVLARIRAEEAACRAKCFTGGSDCRSFRAGATFELQDHYRQDFNQTYLLIAVHHQGTQEIELESGGTQLTTYGNTYRAIPAETVYRPPRVTPKPRITGAINATVDASADGPYAELDDQGRYKVIIPYDISGRGDGQASRFMRMAQPYAGADMGMHFPLHAGTEVLLTHVNGDPDRPVIAAAVPNPDTGSTVTSENQAQSRIRTGSGMEMVFDDTGGTEQVMIHSPHAGTTFRMGGPGSGFDWETGGDWKERIDGDYESEIGGHQHITVEGAERKIDVTSGKEEKNVATTQDVTVTGNATFDSADYTVTTRGSHTHNIAGQCKWIKNGNFLGFEHGAVAKFKYSAEASLNYAAEVKNTQGVAVSTFQGLKVDHVFALHWNKSDVKNLVSAPETEIKGDMKIILDSIDIDIDGGASVKAQSGRTSLELTPSESKFTTQDHKITSSGPCAIQGKPITLESSQKVAIDGGSKLELKGSTVELNGSKLKISGSSVKVCGSSLEVS